MKWREYTRLQLDEMLRHKWIMSEKAGRDLGQSALLDWIEKHAAAFRSYITQTLREPIELPDERQRPA
jgi:hypothetical protein